MQPESSAQRRRYRLVESSRILLDDNGSTLMSSFLLFTVQISERRYTPECSGKATVQYCRQNALVSVCGVALADAANGR